MKQLAEATKEYGDVITSSPSPRPPITASRWRPLVPDETAAAYGTPSLSAKARSNRSIAGPSESCPERSTSSTSSSSRSSRYGDESGIFRVPTLTRCRPSGFGSRRVADRDAVEPVAPALALPANRVEIRLLELERDRADADLVVVHRPHRRHLRSRAGHEDLVGEVEVGADHVGLLDDVPQILRDLDHTLPRYPGQARGRERRCPDLAVLDQEDVLAGAVGDEALRREQDRFVVAGALCLVDGEHRVQVDPSGLGDVRDRVGADPIPGGDLGTDACARVLVPEVVRPRPAHDRDLDRVPLRVDAELAVAVERERPDVALGEPVATDQLVHRTPDLVDRVGQLHVEQLGRVVEPLEVLAQPENGRAVGGLIATDALEDAGAVVEPVDAYVHLCVVPVDELAVHPDRLCLAHRQCSSRGEW